MSGHYVTPDEWRAWMQDHDLAPDRTLAVEIVPESLRDNNAGAVLLRVEQLATDSEGNYPIFDPRPMHDDIAREVVWIPMRHLERSAPAGAFDLPPGTPIDHYGDPLT